MKKKTVIIVDRDQSVRQKIRELTKLQPYNFVFWECSNGWEAVKYINDLQPDLAFIEVDTPGINGFEIAETVTHLPAVIYTANCGKDAARAFEHHAIDYLIKPLTDKRIQLAMNRFDHWKSSRTNSDQNISDIRYTGCILVEKGLRLISIPVSKISYLKADKDYTWIYTIKGDSYLSSSGIGHLQHKLDSRYFVRIHRSYIINMDHIQGLHKEFNKFIVSLPNAIEINVGRNYLHGIKKLIF
ncbi:LytTR family DNA-binding domain-containing protein [Aequorivita sp. SDUM287046]|uniref:LytTR family DNA-binding domain-containing protein n=1 Tax=Aequorivita aurantiaca TaxID=3053356 RepID=A0ABT8DN86_9FLAO|nr:LytTR family DNA-binding domain-containing protein [Aequorivita aurantiaca]MDN3725335.1 LytTR family DNA-binding domain-containing protein [Aequorivita aurantiaca]